MSNVVSLNLYRQKKEQPKPADLEARLKAKRALVNHVTTGIGYIKRLPRATFPDFEPDPKGAA